MTKINAFCYEAEKANAPFKRKAFEIDTDKLKDNEVLIELQYSGLCHSDVIVYEGDTIPDVFPFVGGHEGCGEIINTGKNVDKKRIGETVVVGWYCGSCKHCHQCMSGETSLCDKAEVTILGRKGTFASHVVVDSDYAHKIPEKMKKEEAGIFACAGTTVATYILRYLAGVRKAAVVSCGGLGHLAVQYCVKSGLDTTVISSSHKKDDLAKKLGASNVITYDELSKHKQEFDFIINCCSASIDYDGVVNCLCKKGTMCSVSFPSAKDGEPTIPLPAPTMLANRLTFTSGPCPPAHEFARILEFSARNDIHPMYEVRSLKEINETIKDLQDGKARFRYVFKIE